MGEITCQNVYSGVKTLFCNHEYDLCNTYIFNWECDWFSMTKGGYVYEVEVKVSRSDFFADFKKEKHSLFNRIGAGQKFYFKNEGPCRHSGSIIAQYRHGAINKLGYGVNDYTHKDYLNKQQNYYIHWRTDNIHAQCTQIRFVNLETVLCPHKFRKKCHNMQD